MNAAAAGVIVFIASHFRANFRDDLQLFSQFANQRLLRRFAELDFTAWKFPFKSVAVTQAALPNENAATFLDDAGRNQQRGTAFDPAGRAPAIFVYQCSLTGCRLIADELAQDIGQDAAITVVFAFLRCIDASSHRKLGFLAIGSGGQNLYQITGCR